MSTEQFENLRWGSRDSYLGFNHKSALEMIGGGSVLDLGCGDGTFLDSLRLRKNNAEGVDLSQEAIKKCRAKGHKAELFDFSDGKLPYTDNSFDYVVMLDVLEHLYDPDGLLAEAKRVSRQFVILSVPNFSSLPARLQVVLGHVPENNRRGKGHIFWFNWNVLTKMLQAKNLKIVASKYCTFWQNRFVVGAVTGLLMNTMPNLFALSLVVKVAKNNFK